MSVRITRFRSAAERWAYPFRCALGLLGLLASCATARPAPVHPPPSLDFASVHAFWPVQALLAADQEPDLTTWQRLLDTPGYRRLGMADLKQTLRLAYLPSWATRRAALLASDSAASRALRHLLRLPASRAELEAFEARWADSDLVRQAWVDCQQWLPPRVAEGRVPPPVYFLLFGPDAYSREGAVVFDLRYAADLPSLKLERLLAHEFHHHLLAQLQDKPLHPEHAALRAVLHSLQSEGVADLVDKGPVPLQVGDFGVGSEGYVARYNAEFAQAPARLAGLDALLAQAQAGGDPRALAREAWTLLAFNGHPVGHAMAITIRDQLGPEAVIDTLHDPVEFARAYDRAVQARGGQPVWSEPTLQLLEQMQITAR